MGKDEEQARKARAEKLRKQIARITDQPDTTGEGQAEKPSQDSSTEDESKNHPPSESPRDFVHRRMRELEKKNK